MENGEIVEWGQHDDLVEANSVYASLWRVQTGAAIV
jgi:ABC-type transport system involved in Fe-S cluster assembly fused permease/ATPase subunit